MSEYLEYREDVLAAQGRKTKVVRVHSAHSGDVLGTIKWFGSWRQYTFYPEPGTTFNPDCLRDIAARCALTTGLHREKRTAKERS